MLARSTAARIRPPLALLRASFPAFVLDVLRTLDGAGYRSWLVGGAVRDLLLRRKRGASDHDVATPARPDQVMALFPKVVPTGIEHGTVTVVLQGAPVEVTTFRGEGAYVDGRRPSSVTFLDEVDEDLARRDFTVNALAYDPVGKVFRDPFGGRDDLRRGIIRAVGDPAARFAEDGLRPLRAMRFAAQLDFTLDPATLAAIPPALSVTSMVSVERIAEELSRLLVAPQARHGLELLAETGLLAVVLPEVATTVGPDERDHAFDTVGAAKRDLTIRLAALLHVLAASEPPVAAARRLRSALERMRLPADVCEGAASLVLCHDGCLLAPSRAPLPVTDAAARRWLARVTRARAPALFALWDADARAARPLARSRRERALLRAFRARISRLERQKPPLSVSDLALDGRAIMDILAVPSGPVVGEALRHLLEWVLEDPRQNTRPSLSAELKSWWRSRAS
jgi:tRNA nucleotidyltransferase (CCA-adding enzyme)